MKKEEKILREYIEFADIYGSETVDILPLTIVDIMQKYSEQETQRLKAELAYKDKEIEISHNENRRMERHFLETVTVINSLRELQTEDLKQLQSELTELKEKHKTDDEVYHEIRDFVSKFLKSYGGEGFQKSDIESEGYWYISKNGKDSINLGVFFEEIIEDWEDYYNETHKTK